MTYLKLQLTVLTLQIIVISFLSLIGCSESGLFLNKEFQVAEGENVLIENKGEELNLKFEKVIEYSLCPENVECIWAGTVRIQLIINNNDTLLIGLLNDENPSEITYEDYEISLLNVIPKNEGENLTYSANFIIKEIEL